MESRNDFSKGSIARNILSLALPMTLAQSVSYTHLLLEKKDPVLYEYLKREGNLKKQILKHLQNGGTKRIEDRKEQLRQELLCIEKGMKYYAV